MFPMKSWLPVMRWVRRYLGLIRIFLILLCGSYGIVGAIILTLPSVDGGTGRFAVSKLVTQWPLQLVG
jgi:hypothetical protein